MHIRPLTSFSLLTVLVLGPAACGDDKDPMVSATSPTSPTSPTGPTAPTTDGTDGTNTGTGTGTATDAMTGTTDEPVTTTASPTTPTTTETTVEPDTTTVEPDTTTVEPDTTTTNTTGPDPDTSGTTGDTTGGDADGFYGPCDMGVCPAGSDCVSLMGVEGEFCSPQCGGGMMCPAASGGAMSQCALVLGMGMDPTNCAAVCDVMQDNCPDGTTCKAIPMQMFGVCTAP